MTPKPEVDPLKKAEAAERLSAAKSAEAKAKAEAQQLSSSAKAAEALAKAQAVQQTSAIKMQEKQAASQAQQLAHKNKLEANDSKVRTSHLLGLIEGQKAAAERTPQAVSARLQGLLTGQA
jgi:hypothetical protein